MKHLPPEVEERLRSVYPKIVKTMTGFEWHLPRDTGPEYKTLCGRDYEWLEEVHEHDWEEAAPNERLCGRCRKSARA
jgi:hypothetical protein